MDAATKLQFYHAQWQKKPILQRIYRQWYTRIFENVNGDGALLELGSGSGMGREFRRDIILGDLVFNSWLDLVLDGEKLPLGDESLSDILMIDTLHHLKDPLLFLEDATRVLTTGGRIIAIEPYTGKPAYYFWHYLHHEPVDLTFSLLDTTPEDKEPFDSNQAIPYLLFTQFHQVKSAVPNIQIRKVEFFDLFCYAMSGGFSKPNLVPRFLENFISAIDTILLSIFGRYSALRMMLVLEKVA
jgi:SAM-dependent methyltransferase